MITEMSPGVSNEDYLLVTSARSGDVGARERLGDRIARSAYVFALQLTRNRDAASDIAQDGVLKFFKNLDRFDPQRPIEPWLYQLIRNTVRDQARRDRVRRHDSLDELLEQDYHQNQIAADANATEGSPAADLERRDLERRIWWSVAQLSEAHREIFILRDHHGFTYQEISEVLSIPKGTVMSRLHAARMSLRELLSDPDNPGQSGERSKP